MQRFKTLQYPPHKKKQFLKGGRITAVTALKSLGVGWAGWLRSLQTFFSKKRTVKPEGMSLSFVDRHVSQSKKTTSNESLEIPMTTLRKIDCAARAARQFVGRLHQDGYDRAAIATFGDRFQIEQDFTGRRNIVDQALAHLPYDVRRQPDRSTRLYDSLADAADMFLQAADPRRPWVLLALTDGQDTASIRFRQNPAAIGHHLANGFNRARTNYPFLVGVGNAHEIDGPALATIATYGRFRLLTPDDFSQLGSLFEALALRVTQGLRATTWAGAGFVYREVRPTYTITRQPIDYVLLIDRSASMNAPV